MRTKPALLYPLLTVAMLMWGLTFVFFKFAYESFQPITIVFLRLIISVIFLFAFAKILNKLQPVRRKDYKYIIILALFEPCFYFLGESFGLTFVSSTIGAVIISTIPLIVPIAAYFIYREKLTVLNWFGLFISFGGVLIVVMSNDTTITARLKGVFLMFLAVLSAVGYGLTVKKLAHHYNGYTITAYQNSVGVLFFSPLFIIFDLNDFIHILPSGISVLSLLYLAVFGSSVTFIIFTLAVRELGASKANIFTNLIPVFTAVFSNILLHEPMPGLKITGIGIVLTGLLMSQIKSIKFRKQELSAADYQYPA